MNKPYVKQYDDKGVLLNPIQNNFYLSCDDKISPNRRIRRIKVRQLNNRKLTRGRRAYRKLAFGIEY